MSKLNFTKLKIKNFLSVGNQFLEFDLATNSQTLIVGKNGAGKSQFIDALCFVLFGKPYRKANIPNLVNSINRKNTIVEVEFTTPSGNYKVVRGIKPSIFEIYHDDQLVDQTSTKKDYQQQLEDMILKMSFKTFVQIVILGSGGYIPFMRLTAKDRREIVEDILDIQVFSRMNDVLRGKAAKNKDELAQIDAKEYAIKERISLYKQHLKTIVDEREEKKNEILSRLKNIKIEIDGYKVEKTRLQGEYEALRQHELNAHKKTISETIQSLLASKTAKDIEIGKLVEDRNFFENNEECPTCRQDIEKEFRSDRLNTINDLIASTKKETSDLKDHIEIYSKKASDIEKLFQQINNLEKGISKLDTVIEQLNKKATEYITQYKAIEENSGNQREYQENIDTLNKEYVDLMDEKVAKIRESGMYNLAGVLLKDDGIKTAIIKKYIPLINKSINSYLSLMDFFVSFELNEKFEETIKSRHRDTFSYENFSEGEKARIDLALLFTWRDIAKIKSNTSTNLIIMDEVFDGSLDILGTESLLKILGTLTDSNAYIISHKMDILIDKFTHVIKFEKRNNFTEMINE